MTFTASDFAKAEFARHPDGRVAARTGVDWAQWAFKCSECETNEERNECDGHDFGPDGYMAGNGWVPVQENPRPLPPDAITGAMAARAMLVLAKHGYRPGHTITHEALAAALTEPPARPEGAEEIECELTGVGPLELDRPLSAREQSALADYLASRGVRASHE